MPVTLATLDPALDGLRIVTFSDGHLSATYGGRRFERLVELVNEQRPDVVAIVGDLVDGDVAQLRQALDDSEYIDGYKTYVAAHGLGYAVDVKAEVTMPAYDGAAALRYATPLEQPQDRPLDR